MAPKSSITAKAVRNTFKASGTLFPSRDRMPRAKAMSVAIGIPTPVWLASPLFIAKKMEAGTIIPPNAALKGRSASLKLDNSPLYTSLSNSRPTIRKKIAISPSLIQCSRLIVPIFICHIAIYSFPKDVLDSHSDKAVQAIRISPADFSLSKKFVNSLVMRIVALLLSAKLVKIEDIKGLLGKFSR